MPQFAPGVSKTAKALITVKPAGLNCETELYLVSNGTKAATSGVKSFISTGAMQDISFSITMPALGIYPVYLDVVAQGMLIGVYKAIEDVTCAPELAEVRVAAFGATPEEKAKANYVCNSIADQELQAVLNTYRTVLLSSGTFGLTAELTANYPDTTLRGVGPSTILRVMADMAPHPSPFDHIVSFPKANGRIENLQIDGNQNTYTTIRGIVMTSSRNSDSHISNVTIHSCRAPIKVMASEGGHITVANCHIYNCTEGVDSHHAGIYIISTGQATTVIAEDNTIENIGEGTIYGHGIFLEAVGTKQGLIIVSRNTIERAVAMGIMIDRRGNIIIENNTIKNIGLGGILPCGIYAYGDRPDISTDVILSNNLIYDDLPRHVQHYGICLLGRAGGQCTKRYEIKGNTIHNMLKCGVIFSNVSDCVIGEENTIYDNGAEGKESGVRLVGDTLRTLIRRNVIQNNTKYEIDVASPQVTATTIQDNDLRGTHVQAIHDIGIGTIKERNIEV